VSGVPGPFELLLKMLDIVEDELALNVNGTAASRDRIGVSVAGSSSLLWSCWA
jgi:hypothetical protein